MAANLQDDDLLFDWLDVPSSSTPDSSSDDLAEALTCFSFDFLSLTKRTAASKLDFLEGFS